MRELRAAMDDLRPAGAKRLDIGAVVAATEQENLQDGIDLRAWLSEGLVDTLIPYSSEPVYDSHETAWTDPSQLAFFVDLVRGPTACWRPTSCRGTSRRRTSAAGRQRSTRPVRATCSSGTRRAARAGPTSNPCGAACGASATRTRSRLASRRRARPAAHHQAPAQVGRVGFCLRDAGVGQSGTEDGTICLAGR